MPPGRSQQQIPKGLKGYAHTGQYLQSLIQLSLRHDECHQKLLCRVVFYTAFEVLTPNSISGAYGPGSRYLYYAFLLIPMIFNKYDWLIGGTLGVSMLFSSISAVHGFALAAVSGRGTMDLDIIPIFDITSVGLLSAAPMLSWSKTLRDEATSSARAIVFSWLGLMFVGVVASIASLNAAPQPQACNETSLLEGSCGLICNATLPMRNGQPVISIPYVWKDRLMGCSLWASAWSAMYVAWFASFGILYVSGRHTFEEMTNRELSKDIVCKWLRWENESTTYKFCVFFVIFIPITGSLQALTQLIITEEIMVGPDHVPLGERLDAVGQWETLVGAFFALVAVIMKLLIDRKAPRHDQNLRREWPRSNEDLEAHITQVYRPGLQLKKAPAQTNQHLRLESKNDGIQAALPARLWHIRLWPSLRRGSVVGPRTKEESHLA